MKDERMKTEEKKCVTKTKAKMFEIKTFSLLTDKTTFGALCSLVFTIVILSVQKLKTNSLFTPKRLSRLSIYTQLTWISFVFFFFLQFQNCSFLDKSFVYKLNC